MSQRITRDGLAVLGTGEKQLLDLSGTIYGAYLNTDGNQTGFPLLDYRRPFRINPQFRRYFDLYGRWHPDPHDSRERAKVTFTWGNYWDFKKLYDDDAIPGKARIPPARG